MMQHFLMQRLLLDKTDEQLLSNATIAIAGIGGIGSPALEVLVRNGIPNIRIADYDYYDASNCRQLYQTTATLGNDAPGRAVSPFCSARARSWPTRATRGGRAFRTVLPAPHPARVGESARGLSHRPRPYMDLHHGGLYR